MKTIGLVFLLLCVALCTMAKGAEERPVPVSIIRLIATPKEYAGKRVQITGYLHLEFEGNGIYLHRDDSENAQYKNGLWVEVTEESAKKLHAVTDHYVLLEGTFIADRQGHFGLWSGTIAQITRAEIWSNRPPAPKK